MRRSRFLSCLVAVTFVGCNGVPIGLVLDAGDQTGLSDAGEGDGGNGLPHDGGVEPPLDAGITLDRDAGLPDLDGGTEPSDAGITVPDAGTNNGGTDLGDSVPNSSPICTSNVTWFLGDVGTDLMHPGMACIQCHGTHGGAPHNITFAGTVYPSTHEPDNCNGQSSGWQIVITDAAGKHITLTPNLAGNFRSSEAFTAPYTAQIIGTNGRTREMLDSQTSGDCNSCHTQSGVSGAPGRIVAP